MASLYDRMRSAGLRREENSDGSYKVSNDTSRSTNTFGDAKNRENLLRQIAAERVQQQAAEQARQANSLRIAQDYAKTQQDTMMNIAMGSVASGHNLGRYGQGNIDLYNRPQYKYPNGSTATVESMSFGTDEGEILVPTIDFDKQGNPIKLTDDQAIDRYYNTGEYLGKFKTIDEANAYADKLHRQQDRYYGTSKEDTPLNTSLQEQLANLPQAQVSNLNAEEYVQNRIEREQPKAGIRWGNLGEQLANANRFSPTSGTVGSIISPALLRSGNPTGKDPNTLYDTSRLSEEQRNNAAQIAAKLPNNPLTDAESKKQLDLDKYKQYTFMTDEEKQRYNEIAGVYGVEQAEEYHNLILDDINRRIASDTYQNRLANSNAAAKTMYSFANGISGGIRGLSGRAADYLLGIENSQATPIDEYVGQEILRDPNNGRIAQTAYEIANSTGNMTPGVLASAFTGAPAVGSLVFALSAAGNAYRNSINNGENRATSSLYATQQFVDEEVTNFLLGGISMFGGGVLKKAIDKIGGGVFTNMLDRISTDPAVRNIISRVADYLGDMGSEAAQEYLQFFTENWTKALLNMKDENGDPVVMNLNPADPEALHSALLGALNAGLLNAAPAAYNAYEGANTDISDLSVYSEGLSTDATDYISPRIAEAAENLSATAKSVETKGDKASAIDRIGLNIAEQEYHNAVAEGMNALQNGEIFDEEDAASAAEGTTSQEENATNEDLKQLAESMNSDIRNSLQERLGNSPQNNLSRLFESTTQELSETFGDEGRNLFTEQANSNRDSAAYFRAFSNVYNSGAYGQQITPENQAYINQNMSQEDVHNILMAGAHDSKAAFEASVKRAQQAAESARKFNAGGSAKVSYDFDPNSLTKNQQAYVAAWTGLLKDGLGINVHWYRSDVDATGKYTNPANGSYTNSTNTIALDVYAGAVRVGDSVKLNTTISHEITHWMEVHNPEAYERLKNTVLNALASDKGYKFGDDITTVVANEMKRRGSSRADAEHELVARACEDMLSGSKKAEQFLNSLDTDTKKTIFDHVNDVFNTIKDFFRNLLSGQRSNSEEARSIRRNLEVLEKLQEQWNRMFEEGLERAGVRLETDANGVKFTDGFASDNVTMDGENSAQLSERTYEEGGREYLLKWLDNQKDISQADKDDIVAQVDNIYNIMKEVKQTGELTDYRAWASVGDRNGRLTVITPNGEYPLNIDFATVCKKRKALDHILNVMVTNDNLDAKDLAGADIVKLQELIKKEGLEIACALCFVDSKRYRVGTWANEIVNGKKADGKYGFNELVRSLVPKGSDLKIDQFNYTERDVEQPKGRLLKDADDSELDFTLIDKVIEENASGSWNRTVASAIKNHKNLRSLLVSGELLSSVGFDPIKVNNPELFDVINNAGGSSKPKLSFSEVPYLNDILMSDAMKPETAYKVGGVRIQSFSDFMANMVFDYAQMVSELSAKKLPSHAYTKEAVFVAMFGKTGIKINMSLVPKATTWSRDRINKYLKQFKTKTERDAAFARLQENAGLDEKGNYIWEDETFPYEVAMHFQADPEYAKNCGTIAVGVSDRHIRKLLDDPTIQMVIPYHKSGINPVVARMRNIDLYNDYTNYQNTRYLSSGKKISSADNTFDFYGSLAETNDPKATADAYLKWCDDNAFIPKFEQFRDNENYYKLLADFRLYDETGAYAPQGAVKSIYPDNMKELILDGYKYTDANGVTYENGGLRDAQRVSNKLADATDRIIQEYKAEKQLSLRSEELRSLSEEDRHNYINFKKELMRFERGRISTRNNIKVMEYTPQILLDVGLEDKRIFMGPRHYKNIIHAEPLRNERNPNHYHGLTRQEVSEAPIYLNNPAIIADSISPTGKSSIIVISNSFDYKDRPIILALKTDGSTGYNLDAETSNFMTSMYGRNNFDNFFSDLLSADAILYADKEKSQELFERLGLQSSLRSSNLSFDTIIHQSRNVVNSTLPSRANRQFSLRDGDQAEAFSNTGEYPNGRQFQHRVSDEEKVPGTNKNLLNYLNKQVKDGDYTTTYKALLKIGNQYYPPMASLEKDENGKYTKLRGGQKLGDWIASDGNLTDEMIAGMEMKSPKAWLNKYADSMKNGKNPWGQYGTFKLKKSDANGKSVGDVDAAYNPYQHSSDQVLNDQFEAAYNRPDIVVVECRIPNSEINDPYWAPYAKDPTGMHEWKSGPIAGQLKNTERHVYMTRWIQPVRELSNREVAERIRDVVENEETAPRVYWNTINPNVLQELIDLGVPIDPYGSPNHLKNKNAKDMYGNVISAADKRRIKAERKGTQYSERADYAPTFFSKMEREVESMKQDKIGAASVESYLKGRGVKDEEIKWSGIRTFLDGKKSVTKQELLDFAKANELTITVRTRTDDGTSPIWTDGYTEINEDYYYSTTGSGYGGRGEFKTVDEFVENAKKLAESEDIDPDSLNFEIDEDNGYLSAESDGWMVEAYKPDISELKDAEFENKSRTKWRMYALSGGTNYREITFHMPNSNYINSAMRQHWNEGGVLAHARVQDFNTEDGKKVLFIEEIQSDWHNAGKKSGYNEGNNTKDKAYYAREIESNQQAFEEDPRYSEFEDKLKAAGYEGPGIGMMESLLFTRDQRGEVLKRLGEMSSDFSSYLDEYLKKNDDLEKEWEKAPAYKLSVPDAPFRDNYTDFVLKSLLRMAAEGDYDYLAWTTGKMQEERWSDKYAEGYRIEYDQEIPKFLKKYGKQWKAGLEEVWMYDPEHDQNYDVPAIVVNDAMKESVLYEGQPQYSERDVEQANRIEELVQQYNGDYVAALSDIEVEYERKLSDVRAEYEQQIEKLNAEIEKTKGKEREKKKESLKKLREKKNQKIKDLKQEYRDKVERARERRKDRDARTRLLRKARELARMKGGPEFEASKQDLIGDLDMIAKGIMDKTRQKLEEMKARATALAEEDENYKALYFDSAREVFERLEKKHIKDMSGEEVEELTNKIVELIHQERTSKELLADEQRKLIADEARRSIEQQRRVRGIDDRNIIKSFAGRFGLNMLNPTRAFQRIDGYQNNGVFTNLGKHLNDGQTKMNTFVMKASKKFNDFLEKHPDLVRTWYKADIDTGYKDKNGKPVYINKGMRIALYLHSLNNDQNMRHIAEGGIKVPDAALYNKGQYEKAYRYGTILQMKPTEISALLAEMTDDEKAFANLAHEFLNNDTKKAINDTSLELTGTMKAIVDNYFPIRTDPNFTMKDITGLVVDGTIEGMGMLKERVKGAKNAILLEDVAQVLQRQTNNTGRYYGLAIPVRDFNKILKFKEGGINESVRSVLDEVWGDAGINYITDVLNNIQAGSPAENGPGAKLFNTLKGTYAGTVLNWNLGVAIKQSASAPFAAVVLDPKSIAKAFAMNAFSKADYDYMDSITPWSYMRRQGMSGTEMGEVYRQKNAIESNRAWQKFKQKTNFIQNVDVWTTDRLFFAAEYYVRDHFPELKVRGPEYNLKVAEIYNDMLQRTQPSYDVMQRNAYLRSGNTLTKIMGMFKTQTFNMGGEIIDAAGRLNAYRQLNKQGQVSDAQLKEAKAQFGKTVGAAAVSQLMLAALAVVAKAIMHNMKDYRDDNGEVTPESVAARGMYEFLTSFAGMFMGGNELQSYLLSLSGKEKWYDLAYPGISVINDLASSSVDMTDAFRKAVDKGWDDESASKFRKKAIQFAMNAAIVKRIPADNIYKIGNAINLWVQDYKNGMLGSFAAGEGLLGLKDSSPTADQYANMAINAYKNGNSKSAELAMSKVKPAKIEDALGAEAKKDENGDSISGSKMADALQKVNDLDMSMDAKLELILKMYPEKTEGLTADLVDEYADMMSAKVDGKQEGVVEYLKEVKLSKESKRILWELAGYKASTFDKAMNK